MSAIPQSIRDEFPWPDCRPDVGLDPFDGWFGAANRDNLKRLIGVGNITRILELGTCLGASTRFMLDLDPDIRLVTVDNFTLPDYPNLRETCITNCWNYRDRLTIMPIDSVEGMEKLHQAGFDPQLIYIDADHTTAGVLRDIDTSIRLFPDAILTGDDYYDGRVRGAVWGKFAGRLLAQDQFWMELAAPDILLGVKSRDDIPALIDLLLLSGDGVEVGVYWGEFSKTLLSSGLTRLFSVDAWVGGSLGGGEQFSGPAEYIMAINELLLYGLRSIPLKMLSLDAAQMFYDESLDVVYIDADHSYANVCDNLAEWWPKVRPGGLFAGHDYCDLHPGVVLAVNEFAAARGVYVGSTQLDSLHLGKYPLRSWMILKP